MSGSESFLRLRIAGNGFSTLVEVEALGNGSVSCDGRSCAWAFGRGGTGGMNASNMSPLVEYEGLDGGEVTVR